jgi:hypothetical protein
MIQVYPTLRLSLYATYLQMPQLILHIRANAGDAVMPCGRYSCHRSTHRHFSLGHTMKADTPLPVAFGLYLFSLMDELRASVLQG